MLAATETKNAVLLNIAEALVKNTDKIILENKKDIAKAKDSGINETMIDRLLIDESRVLAMANGVKQVIELPDPIGKILQGKTLPNNLKLQKISVPLGVIGMIYESRPNVTVDATVLCLKASNAVILRGGKEAIHTNKILASIMQQAIANTGLNPFIIGLIEDTTRESAHQLMKLNQFLDVLIPRGSAGLIQTVIQNATVPVIETGVGNCHIYVEATADLVKAVDIVDNAKTSRPSVCNACESLLVDEEIAKVFLPMIAKRPWKKDVTIVGCEKTIDILGSKVTLATDEDYFTEFLDYKISIKVVKDIKEAVKHIEHYSSHHSEAILTESLRQATYFVDTVDSAAVYVNVSTRFTDGEEFGFGAEIGISTQKLHARGPMGLEELATTKYIIYGDGQIR